MSTLLYSLIIGIGATVVMDLWGILRKHLLGVPPPNYGMVGRWVGHMPLGRFQHDAIANSTPVRGEWIIGWAVHYLIGVAFAGILIAVWGVEWIQQPAIGPALVVGIGTILAPFLLMQPGMGAGIAASRTPNPAAARMQSLVSHGVFGFGLWVAGWVLHGLAHVAFAP